MSATRLLALCAFASGATQAANPDWNAPQEPFAIHGNTYYVGTRGLSSLLVTSKAGHILIDGGSQESPRQIVAHIRQLGFRIEDVKYILNSHEHFDHAGGIAELQRLSGATVLSSVLGESVLRTGLTSKGDPQYADLPASMPAVANTRALRDGEQVRLGPLSVRAHYTPGHTQGGTSWSWQSTQDGRTVDLVYADSLTAFAAKPFRYSGYPSYPRARADLERSIATIATLKCDILVSTHPEASGLWERKTRQAALGAAAFIDADACRDYAQRARERLAETLAGEAGGGQPAAGSFGFNWLQPEDAKCTALAAAELAQMKTCTASDNAFGLSLPSHACKLDARTELIVYPDAAQCQEALEAMQANAP